MENIKTTTNFEQWTFDRLLEDKKIIYIITFCDRDFQAKLTEKGLTEDELLCFANGVFCKKSDWNAEYKKLANPA